MGVLYIVDDDPLVTDSLGTALRLETPYEVLAFQSPAAALAAMPARPPDMVVSDFKMPGMDGLALLREVHARHPDCVLLLLTGYADKESAIAAINEVGIYQYVEKPWDLSDLLLKVRAGLERQSLVRDLDETNARLARRNAELEASLDRLVSTERVAAVGRVASGIAHEIGNQLALVGYAEAIKARAAGCPAAQEIREFADVIVAAQRRLAALVTEIKDFARAGAQAIPLEPADVAAVVEEALSILRYDRDVVAMKLVRQIRAKPLARLHRGKFAQVVINLVKNAAQASRAGQEIRVALDETPAAITLTVADDGAGMTPEVLRRVGEPLFSTRGDGTGLGIGICRRIVAEHGGTLAFDSHPGEGTRVTVSLPALGTTP